MFFHWLKQYMPRSLYGRAALIMVLPIVVLQLVVSVVFLQRHLEDVTVQMTRTMVREVRLVAQQADPSQTSQQMVARAQPILDVLNMGLRDVEPDEAPFTDDIGLIDYSGHVVADTLYQVFPETLAVQFADNRVVRLVFQSQIGPMAITFDRRRVTAAAPHQLIVTMLFFGMLMTVIAFLYMRNQLRPIKRLAEAAQAFGRGRVEPYWPTGATEVRIAGSAFLDMRARIERQIEQRTMMLSGVSHDLRTPLTRLRLGLAMIDEEDAEPLLQDVDDMQRLLDAFLDFSRGAGQGTPETIAPDVFLRRAVEDAKREGKLVELGECQGTGDIKLHPTAMRRAVDNLIGNAVRYGNRAKVSYVLSDKSLRIRVEDDGPGIPADLRGDAIKPFTRLDPARNQNQGSGVGLGLAIVADIARAHGGTLRLGESRELGGLQADIVIAR
ncbi:two-component sensor histidine kinase [Rhodobacteraceae bacterium M382]|nr:two-component sensor histidine kinase [Rhodobacteraceae bacterium M382]